MNKWQLLMLATNTNSKLLDNLDAESFDTEW